MSYIDEDFNKLIHYTKGLGVKVSIKDYIPYSDDAGYWITDDVNSEIQIMRWKNQSKTKTTLILLHELAHHLGWVYADKKFPDKYHEASEKEAQRKKSDPFIDKSLRKAVYELELRDSKYQHTIAFEVGLRIPKWKIDLEIAVDMYVYRQYYLTGEFPSVKQTRKRRKILRKQICQKISES